MQFDGEDLVQGRLTKPRKLVKIQEIFPPRLRTTRTRAATRNATVERRDVGKWMRNETEQRRKIDDNGGDASISRRLTGEPDAVDPPVWFGGRGKVKTLVPTPIDFAGS